MISMVPFWKWSSDPNFVWYSTAPPASIVFDSFAKRTDVRYGNIVDRGSWGCQATSLHFHHAGGARRRAARHAAGPGRRAAPGRRGRLDGRGARRHDGPR